MRNNDHDHAALVTAELAATTIPSVERAEAVTAPSTIDRLWIWDQTEALADEQCLLYTAESLNSSRPVERTARALEFPADMVRHQVAGLQTQADAAGQYATAVRQALAPFVVREPGDRSWYLIRMLLLYVGDITAMTSVCILTGELPILGAVLAASVGAAAVIGGLAGGDVKRAKLAKERALDPDQIPEHQLPWRHLFSSSSAGATHHRLMAQLAGLIAALLVVGVVSLRLDIEEPVTALAYGLFAAAIALASWWNTYEHTDPCAAAIDSAEHAAKKLNRQVRRLATSRVVRRREAAVADATSIQAEYTARGQAAGRHLEAAKCVALTNNPAVAGHGPAVNSPPPVRSRRGGDA